MKFSGTYTAIITPFCEDESIDYDALNRLVEEQISAGVDGIVVAGTTGESPTLSWEEHNKMIAKMVQMVNGRVQVIAGTGANCTREAVDGSMEAEKNGVDALLVVVPYYNKPSQQGIFDYYTKVCHSVSVPVIGYNVPGRCGVNMLPETMKQIKDACPNFVGVKECNGVEQAQKVRELCGDDFVILSGNDDQIIVLMEKVRANGVISVISNALPKETKQMTTLAAEGKWQEAYALQESLLEKIDLCFVEANPMPIKTLLANMGKCKKVFRSPMTPIHPENEAKLLKAFEIL